MSGYVALGKYSNEFEDALHYLCTSGWSNGEFGNVEAPTGFVWQISNNWEEVKPLNGEFNSLMEEWFEQNPTVEDTDEFRRGLVGDFIVREDNNGLVFLTKYETLEAMAADYVHLYNEFSLWDSQDES